MHYHQTYEVLAETSEQSHNKKNSICKMSLML